MGALSQLKVVELATVLAGPLVGTYFAERGSRVIKIENPATGGDPTRGWRTPEENPDELSAYYQAANGGKDVVWLNLKNEGDRDQVYEMLAGADIVITNFLAETAVKLGMDTPTLRQRFPQLIIGEVYGFEQDSRPAFDALLQAETGYMYMNRPESGVPNKIPVALIDVLCALHLRSGLLEALLKRAQTGEGSVVRAGLERAALTSWVNVAAHWRVTGQAPEPMGSAHPQIAPYGDTLLCAKNTYLVFAVGTEAQFRRLWRTLFFENVIPQEFATNALRVAHRVQLLEQLSVVIAAKEAGEWVKILEGEEVPVAEVKSLEKSLLNASLAGLWRGEVSRVDQGKALTTLGYNIF